MTLSMTRLGMAAGGAAILLAASIGLSYAQSTPTTAKAQQHQSLYYRFKADETATHIRGPYERAHPEDNNEAQPVHEHEG